MYNQSGVPLVSDLDTSDDIERRSIEGGFLVAITQFCNMKLPNGEKPSTVTFESHERGNFIVARTEHYIGSLLWRKDLGIPIDKSKAAIIDLLKYLENCCDYTDMESVQSHVQQFTTDLS